MSAVIISYQAGSSCDLRLFKAYLLSQGHNVEVLSSSVNEGQTMGDIAEMGASLATEVAVAVNEMRGAVSRIRYLLM